MQFYKTILISLLLSPVVNTYAQNCKFDKDEKDDFSGEVVRLADQRMGNITTHWNLILEQRGAKYYIGLKHIINGSVKGGIKEGDKFYLKLENGKVVTVSADQDYAPSYYAANGGVATTVTTRGEVDEATIKELSSSPVTNIKLVIGGNDKTQPQIPSRQAEKVMDYAACLLKGK